MKVLIPGAGQVGTLVGYTGSVMSEAKLQLEKLKDLDQVVEYYGYSSDYISVEIN